jgi:hypothetical protein
MGGGEKRNSRKKTRGKIKKEKRKRNKKSNMEKGIIDISSSHPSYTVRRNYFATRLVKTASAPLKKPLT